MIAVLSTMFVTMFGVGHIAPNGYVPHMRINAQYGHTISASLPPRTELSDLSACHWTFDPRVNGKRMRWDKYNVVMRAPNVTFDGMTFANNSFTKWINVSATIVDESKLGGNC